jgi:hypothetical protein
MCTIETKHYTIQDTGCTNKVKKDGFIAAQRFVGAVSVTEVSRSQYVKENCKTVRN